MHRTMLVVFLMAPMTGLLGGPTPQARGRGERQTFEALERQGRESRNELGKISLENMVGGRGSRGFESQLHRSPQNKEWRLVIRPANGREWG
jgi:hypothetical protein